MALAPLSRSPVSCPLPGPSHKKDAGQVHKPEEGAHLQRQQETEKTRQQPSRPDSFETKNKQAHPSDPASKPEPKEATSKQQPPQQQPPQFGKNEQYVSHLSDLYQGLSQKEIKQGNIQDPVKALAESEQQTLDAILDNITAAAGEVATA